MTNLSYIDSGAGETIIFIHGFASDGSVWESVSKRLSDKFRIIAVHLRGYGLSQWRDSADFIETSANDIKNLADILRLKQLAIFGWSLGGMAAIKAAVILKAKVTHLGLIATTAKFIKDAAFPFGVEKAAFLKMIKMLSKDIPGTLDYFRDIMLSEDEKKYFGGERLNRIFSKVAINEKRALFSSLDALEKIDLRPVLPDIKQPTLIVHGKIDNICLFGAARYLKENIKNSCLKAFENTGHIPFLTKEDEFVSEVEKFLRV